MRAPRRSFAPGWICALLAVCAPALAAGPPPAAAANGFAFDLYAQVRSAEGNLFVSPFSVRTALAMVHAGARGETAAQLRRVLRQDGEDGAAGLEALAGEGGAFGMANRIWGERTYAFLPDFVDRIGDLYDGGLEQVDFVGDAQGARARINGWVESSTDGRIVDLLPPDAVSAATRLAIVNAVHFRGAWARPFDPTRTHDAPFHREDGSTVHVPLMGFGTPPLVPFYAGDGMRAIEVAYGDGGFAMLVVLPEGPGGLAALEARLDAATLQSGVADLSGIDGTRDLFVGAVFHQAFVAVHEEGTAAAAATAAVVLPASAPPPPADFCADRPFLFLVRAVATGDVVFLGRLVDLAER